MNSDIIAGGYTQIPQKFYHPDAKRNALGLVGGNDVSLVAGNMVDVESELRGITRDLSKAPAKKYYPKTALGSDSTESTFAPYGEFAKPASSITFMERHNQKVVQVSLEPKHLPTTQYVSYPGVPNPKPLTMDVYGSPWRF